MRKSILIILFVLGVIIIFGLGLGAMFLFMKMSPEIKKAETTSNFVSSKVITSITAFGKVESIIERKITLTNAGDSVTFLINDKGPIYSLKDKNSETGMQKKVDFEDIKEGDNLNVGLKLMADGSLEGQSIIILPE